MIVTIYIILYYMLHDVLGENRDRDIIKSDNIVVAGHKSLVVST